MCAWKSLAGGGGSVLLMGFAFSVHDRSGGGILVAEDGVLVTC